MANFGYAVLRLDLSSAKPKVSVLKYGRLLSTVDTMKDDLQDKMSNFCAELSALDEEFGVDAVIAERYQSRRMGGTTIEFVNFMLGVTVKHFATRRYRLIPASQWKNAAARAGFWFDDLYASMKPLGVTPHAIDAVCIGIYGVCLILKVPPYKIAKLSSIETLLKKAIHADIGRPRTRTPKKKTKKLRRQAHSPR